MKIGKVITETDIFLAPMAAVNCPAFRLQCQSYGAALTYTQMIDVDIINSEPDFYERFIDRLDGEGPLAVQVIGNKPKPLALAIERIEEHADIIDFNLGCSEKEMLSKQYGSFLLKHTDQLERAVSAIMGATNKPVTAKIRSGWDNVNAIKVSVILEDHGVSAIAVHPRLKTQGYSGKADWDVIRLVKDRINIPVIGNGDVIDYASAKRIFDETHCDAIMIGRAAIGNPSIFKEILEKKKESRTIDSQKKIFMDFCNLYHKQSRQRFPELKQHAKWFFKGTITASEIKEKIDKADDEEELISYLRE